MITLREHLRLHLSTLCNGPIVGDHIGRELLRLHRVEGLQWAELSVITLGESSCDSIVSKSVMGRIDGDHIGRMNTEMIPLRIHFCGKGLVPLLGWRIETADPSGYER